MEGLCTMEALGASQRSFGCLSSDVSRRLLKSGQEEKIYLDRQPCWCQSQAMRPNATPSQSSWSIQRTFTGGSHTVYLCFPHSWAKREAKKETWVLDRFYRAQPHRPTACYKLCSELFHGPISICILCNFTPGVWWWLPCTNYWYPIFLTVQNSSCLMYCIAHSGLALLDEIMPRFRSYPTYLNQDSDHVQPFLRKLKGIGYDFF